MLEVGRTERGPAKLTLSLWSGSKLLIERDEPAVVVPDLSPAEQESILATGCYTIEPAERKAPQATIPQRRRAAPAEDKGGEDAGTV